MHDLVAFQVRAARYLAHKRVPVDLREDLVQEMCVEVLARPDAHLNLEYVARHALDRLDPRLAWRADGGPRRRRSALLAGPSLNAQVRPGDDRTWADVLAAPERDHGDPLARQWLVRQCARLDARTRYIVRRYFWDDVAMHTIATEVGLSETRIVQIVMQTLRWLGVQYSRQARDALPRWNLRREVA